MNIEERGRIVKMSELDPKPKQERETVPSKKRVEVVTIEGNGATVAEILRRLGNGESLSEDLINEAVKKIEGDKLHE